MDKPRATREAIGEALVELGGISKDIVVLDADLSCSTQTAKFAREFPDRFFNFGVAEANMVGAAAGLALSGKIPFISTFAVFATSRVFDQVRQSIAQPSLNVRICSSHGGITVGEDGSSHQSIEDVALMRVLPNMRVIVPTDFFEAKAAIKSTLDAEGPFYIRTGRSPVLPVFDESYQFQLGKAVMMADGSDCSILANGIEVPRALGAREVLLSKGIEAEIINVSSVKPLDRDAIIKSAQKTGAVVTVEEHSIIGGLGSAVSELLGEELPTPMRRLGVRDMFGCSGDPESLLTLYGLTTDDIVSAVLDLLGAKEPSLGVQDESNIMEIRGVDS